MNKQIRIRLIAWAIGEVGGILAILAFWAFMPGTSLLTGLVGITAGTTLVTAGFMLGDVYRSWSKRRHPLSAQDIVFKDNVWKTPVSVSINLSGVASPDDSLIGVPDYALQEQIRRRLNDSDGA